MQAWPLAPDLAVQTGARQLHRAGLGSPMVTFLPSTKIESVWLPDSCIDAVPKQTAGT